MKSDRTQRRPNIILCVAAALLAIAPASIVRAADGSDSLRMGGASDPAGQRLQLGVGQSVIVDLPEEAGEIYVGDPNDRQRDRALGEARLYFRRRQRPDQHFRVGQGRAKNCGHPGLGRARRRRIVEPAQHRHPRQRNSRAHGREHDHPDRVGRVGRGGSEGARYR